jgi:YVTN family beta-propeller protein
VRLWAKGMAALLLGLAVILSACAGSAPSAATRSTPAPLPILVRPPQLAAYHIFVTDAATGDLAELGVQTLHLSRSIHGLGLSADHHTLYVTDIAGGRLLAYALAPDGSLSHPRAVTAGSQPVHAANTPDGARLFVTDFGGATVTMLDTTHWTRAKEIVTPAGPHGIALSPDGRTAYVACSGGAALAVLDTATAALTATIPLPPPAAPTGVVLSPDGRYAYITDTLAGRLLTVDLASRRVAGSVPVGQRPALLARAPDGHALYIADGASAAVTVLDLARDPAAPTVRATIHVGGYPHGIAVTPDGRYVIVANTIGKNLSVIDAATLTVVATIPAERYPNDVIVAP